MKNIVFWDMMLRSTIV